jgi:hypothetical protein
MARERINYLSTSYNYLDIVSIFVVRAGGLHWDPAFRAPGTFRTHMFTSNSDAQLLPGIIGIHLYTFLSEEPQVEWSDSSRFPDRALCVRCSAAIQRSRL